MKRAREDSSCMGPQLKKSSGSAGPRLTTEDALGYLKAVKERFKDDNERYSEFLEVMKNFKAQRIDTPGVVVRVKELFKDHQTLILGFNAFLPKGYEILPDEQKEAPHTPTKKPVEFDQAISFVNKIKNRFQDNEQVYKAFLEILNMYRTGTKSITEVYEEVDSLFRDHPDLLNEFTCFLPDSSNVHSKPVGHRKDKDEKLPRSEKSGKKEKGLDREADRAAKQAKELRRKSEKERDKREEREECDREADLEGQRHKRKSARRADELIRKQSQAGEGTNLQKDYAFFEKVKGKLRNRSYQGLLKILNLYNEQIINRADLQSMVGDILGKYPELLVGFNDLLVRCEIAEMDFDSHLKTVKLESKEQDRERERDKEKDKDREKEKEKERDSDRERPSKDHKSLLPGKEKYMNKPISELDLSSCERCTPSYRLLPKNYPRLLSSHRTELANSVLNDSWVSVTSGSEDYSFKHMRRNQYEESLFRCEDDRFELDMLLESTVVTAKHVEELMKKLHDSNGQVRIDDYLSAINYRCIERIYGDHGLDMLELLRKNSTVVLPVVYFRLKQKQEEWSKCRSEMNKVWAEVYSKNYHKSLDHRSFYFKQQDKKSLSTKALLAEIRDVHDRKRKEDDSVISTLMGSRRLLLPDLKYGFSDSSIHEDLYQIMKYSADEVCNTMEQSDKIMRVWTTFLESMFGVPSRIRGTEDAEEAAKVQRRDRKERKSSSESTGSGSPGMIMNGQKTSPGQDEFAATACSKPTFAERGALDALESNFSKKTVEIREEQQISPLKSDGGDDNTDGAEARNQTNGIAEVSEFRKETVARQRRTEREEGELSPSPEVDERQNHDPDQHASKERLIKDVKREDYGAEVDPEHDADPDDEESAQKSSEDSENGSEVSGSDSSREDDEDEDGDDDQEKGESECEAEGMADAEGDGCSTSPPDKSSMFCKPLAAHPDILDTSRKDRNVFYGNDMFYILFRLHQTLYERIFSAKTNAVAAEQKWKSVKDTAPPDLYEKFVRVLHNLLDGSADNSKYEDECRSIIGTQSYLLFTLDKLIFKLVKQLQTIVADETASKLLSLYAYEKARGIAGFDDFVYQANASVLMHDENLYRYEFRRGSSDLIIQLLDTGSEKLEVPASAMELSFSSYLNNFFLLVSTPKQGKMVFLLRNKRNTEKADELNTLVVNGLEYKISCKTYKVSYVLDTEDLFWRQRSSRSRPQKGTRRVRKFRDWVERKLKC